jgi:hypothetical protein
MRLKSFCPVFALFSAAILAIGNGCGPSRQVPQMTQLCPPRVIQHQARHVALWRVGKRAFAQAPQTHALEDVA